VTVSTSRMLEPLQTLGARVRHLPRVHPHVAGKLLPLSEIGATLLTLIRLLSCVNSLMNQSFAVAIKSFGTIAADKSVCVEVNYFFMSFEGRLVLQDFAALRAWNLFIILLQHLVLAEVIPHAPVAATV